MHYALAKTSLLLQTAQLTTLAFLTAVASQAKDIDITAAGAKSAAGVLNTVAIQDAIDTVSAAGGGTVTVPTGTFVTAPLQLRSHVTLRLDRGATLLCSTNPADSSHARGFIAAEDCDDIGIEGPGAIDGNGHVFKQVDNAPGRPNLLFLHNSRDVTVRNVTLRNSAMWTCRLLGCDGVRINAVRIYSHQGLNNDGIDIDSRNVAVSDCLIDCDDDAICFKSDTATPCENVTVMGCVAASNCSLIKMGTSSVGGFRNITVANCVLHPASEDNWRHWKKNLEGVSAERAGISGIALEVVDGGKMEQVCINNIAMTGVQTPVFIRLGSRRNPTGTLRNVIISNISATTESLISSSITGVPGHFVENVILRDMWVEVMGNGTEKHAGTAVPEKEKTYPENRMFGQSLPSYGLYMRHAKGVTLDNVHFRLRNPDARPAIVMEDVHGADFRNLRAAAPSVAAPLLRIDRCSRVAVTGFRTEEPLKEFVHVIDGSAGSVKFFNNDFTGVERISNVASDTPR